ncbi:MAG: TetR/AcrR family transcriptional regulator [Bacteroidota bacterium]
MKLAKRTIKEQRIIDAAEEIFALHGFRNTRMDEIAKSASITKVTLYAYFQSKENLHMAITYRAFQLLTNKYYEAIDATKSKTGLDSSMAITKAYIEFCEGNALYADCMLEYLSIMRVTLQGKDTSKMTEALVESTYFKKCQDIQQLPTRLSIKELERGQKDGSIINTSSPLMISLKAWMLLTGFAKIISISRDGSIPMYNMSLEALKTEVIQTARFFLVHNAGEADQNLSFSE